MKNLAFAFGLVGVLASPLALAQAQIVGFVPSTESKVTLYNAPAEGSVAGEHRLGAEPWPLNVVGAQAGFLQVSIGGTNYWVKAAQVRLSRGSSAGCTTARIAPTTQTSSTPGVGKSGC